MDKGVMLVLRGGGGHASVVWDAWSQQVEARDLLAQGAKIILWDDQEQVHPTLSQWTHVRSGDRLLHEVLESPSVRKRLVEEMRQLFNDSSTCLEFPSVVHPTAVLSTSCSLGQGSFVGPLAVVHTAASVGDFCVVNSHAVVEHDCVLHDYATVNPHAVLCGTVQLGEGSLVAANATVREKVCLAAGVTLGMDSGAITTISEPGGTWVGTPASLLRKSSKAGATSSNRPADGAASVSASHRRSISWCPHKDFDNARFSRYLMPSLHAGHVTNFGPLQAVLSSKIQGLVGCRSQVVCTSSGTAALHALAAGWALKLGRELRWATQAFTFPSSFQGPLQTAIVVDQDPEAWGPSLEGLAGVASKIDGVIVTNVFGLMCDVLLYERWCREHNKLLIMDNAATTYGVCTDGRSIHDVGDGAFISLHETKPIGRGEGGAVMVPGALVPFVKQAMSFGFNTSDVIRYGHRWCSNWKMSDIAAAAACDHLDAMEEKNWIKRWSGLSEYAVKQVPLLAPGFEVKHCPPSPYMLPCLMVTLPAHLSGIVEELCRRLNKRTPVSVEAKHYYVPLASRNEAPVAWGIFDRCVNLPLNVDMGQADVDCEIMALRDECKAIEEARKLASVATASAASNGSQA